MIIKSCLSLLTYCLLCLRALAKVESSPSSNEHQAQSSENFFVDEIREHFLILNASTFELEVFYESASICLDDFVKLIELGVDVALDVAGFNGLINEQIRVQANATSVDMRSMVALYNLAVPYAELLFQVLTESSQKLEMLNRVEVYLNIMAPLLHPSARHIAFNMQVKHYTTEGEYLLSLSRCSRAESAFELALNIFNDMEGSVADQALFPPVLAGLDAVSTCTEIVTEESQEARGDGAAVERRKEKSSAREERI